jgi:hypothetical protein
VNTVMNLWFLSGRALKACEAMNCIQLIQHGADDACLMNYVGVSQFSTG